MVIEFERAETVVTFYYEIAIDAVYGYRLFC